jgi:para-aminobenzoate synthetase component 1
MRSALTACGASNGNDGGVSLPPFACVGGFWGSELLEVTGDPARLDDDGRWVTVLPYQGQGVYLRFKTWDVERPAWVRDVWHGPMRDSWNSSLDEASYCAAVERTRDAIARGDVYQANICRVMSAETRTEHSLLGLFDLLTAGNPSPFASIVNAPLEGVEIVSASPELFLRRSGSTLTSGPIKGTGRTERDLLAKDSAENIMIVDLVRNDLSRVCVTGSVEVPRLLGVEEHPGLVHLVSEVSGTLVPNVTWRQILDATFPPGSVTGAPKSAALRIIKEQESVDRRFYCGALGWIDHQGSEAELAVTIRTFWREGSMLNFGTGAGITWESDPEAEWQETVLKASRLIELASAEGS